MASSTVNAGSGGGEGDLFGDLWVVVRDLDPSDGGGNGEPVLDANGQIVPVGYDPATDEIFPIHLVAGTEEDYEVPPELLPYVQEIELERANIIRAPEAVREAALAEALDKIANGTTITTDASGRIAVDGVLIDSPRENGALYHLIMTAGGVNSWSEVQANAATNLPPALANLIASGWNPAGLLGAVFSKFTPISLDAVITAHTLMGVNEVDDTGPTLDIDYFGFTDGVSETFNYDRVATYGDLWMRWYQDLDGDPSDLEAVERSILDVVWGSDRNGDGVNDVGSGQKWVDEYIQLSTDGLSFEVVKASAAGINDWAQAVEDARAVIEALHESVGAVEIPSPPVADDVLTGTLCADLLAGWGGNDLLIGLSGDDWLEGGDGNDILKGGGGNDVLEGGRDIDRLRGGAGDDILRGNAAADKLFGGDGNDKLFGGADADRLDGGDGDDKLYGGVGGDELTGGLGADRFIFVPLDPSSVNTITDFSTAELDIVNLARIDADSATEENDAFSFVGYAAFTGVAGELRAVDLGGTQRIEGDVDGDMTADIIIDIAGTIPAEAGWFTL